MNGEKGRNEPASPHRQGRAQENLIEQPRIEGMKEDVRGMKSGTSEPDGLVDLKGNPSQGVQVSSLDGSEGSPDVSGRQAALDKGALDEWLVIINKSVPGARPEEGHRAQEKRQPQDKPRGAPFLAYRLACATLIF